MLPCLTCEHWLSIACTQEYTVHEHKAISKLYHKSKCFGYSLIKFILMFYLKFENAYTCIQYKLAI